MLRGLFLEAFSTGSGRAVAVGSVCDSGSRSTRHSRRDTGRSQQELCGLCLPCLSPEHRAGSGVCRGKGNREMWSCREQAGLRRLRSCRLQSPLGGVNTGDPSLEQGGSASDSLGPAERPQPGYLVSRESIFTRIKPDNCNSMRQSCQKNIPLIFPTSPVLENTPGGSAVTTAAASQSCIPPR